MSKNNARNRRRAEQNNQKAEVTQQAQVTEQQEEVVEGQDAVPQTAEVVAHDAGEVSGEQGSQEGGEEAPKEPVQEVKMEAEPKSAEAQEPEVPTTPAKPEPAPAPVVEQKEDEVKEKNPVHQPVAKVEAPKQEESRAVVLLKQNLEAYSQVMAPGQEHTVAKGSAAQTQLYRTIMAVLKTEGQDFHKAMGLLCKFIGENRKGLFNERYCFRYFDTVNLSTNERKNFERLLNLLLTLWNPQIRSIAVKQVDIAKSLEGIMDQGIHQRVYEFFAVV